MLINVHHEAKYVAMVDDDEFLEQKRSITHYGGRAWLSGSRIKPFTLLMVFRTDFRVTSRGDPGESTEIYVNGILMKLPNSTKEEVKLPKGDIYYGEIVLEVSPLSILFSVFEKTCE